MTAYSHDAGTRAGLAASQMRRILLAVVASFTGLQLATWPLWWGGTTFPQVPIIRWLEGTPLMIQRAIWLAELVTATVLLLFLAKGLVQRQSGPVQDSHRMPQISASMLLFALSGLLVLINQHRLQPWCWLSLQLILISIVFRRGQGLQVARWALIAVYLFSAVSRIGPAATVGPMREIAETLLRLAGLQMAVKSPFRVDVICHVAAGTELLTAVFLLLRRTRKYGIIGVWLIHGSLLLALGPFGMDHHAGVLLWNASLMVIVPLAFGSDLPVAVPAESRRWPAWAAALLVFGVPALALFGLGDRWLGWQVYSSRTTPPVVLVELEPGGGVVPAELEAFLGSRRPLEDRWPLQIDRWSLDETRAPVYPSVSFYHGVLERVEERLLPGTLLQLYDRERLVATFGTPTADDEP